MNVNNNYDFDGFTLNLYVDEEGDWLAHLVEMPNISAFSDTPSSAIDELKVVWEINSKRRFTSKKFTHSCITEKGKI